MVPSQDNYTVSRRYPRRSFDSRIGIFIGGHYIFGHGLSISEGGILLECRQNIPAETVLELHFMLPSGRFFSIGAKVLYVLKTQWEAYRIGFEFVSLKDSDLEDLRKFTTR